MNQLFGTDTLFDPEDFAKLFARLGLNLVFLTIIVWVVYYRLYRNRELVFTYYTFNIITFSLCVLLRKTSMDMGFALGLFGIFSILRYRTEQIGLRDLTYLFIVLGMAILNAVANKKVSLAELWAANLVITVAVAGIELLPRRGRLEAVPLLYDRMELLADGKTAELLADLSRRLGVPVEHVQVRRIDLIRDAAELLVFCRKS